MLDSEKSNFARLVRSALLVCGGSAPDAEVLRVWWAVFERSEFADVSAAFGQYVARGKFPPRPGDITEILDRLKPDGRPGADEAWATIPQDEMASAVMSNEMAEAWGIARPLLVAGDAVAARMAFKGAYERIVMASKAAGRAPEWFPSLGWDQEGRAGALADAVRRGRLTTEHALRLLAPEKQAEMLALAGVNEHPLLAAPSPEGAERLRYAVAGSAFGGAR